MDAHEAHGADQRRRTPSTPTAKAEEAGRRTGSPDSEAPLQLVIPPWADAAYVVEVAQPTHWVGAGQRGGETEYEVYPARKRGRGSTHTTSHSNGAHSHGENTSKTTPI
ncbi:hypothetical protein B9Q03_10550 [Candidatus Marsarchaeota G2 archaeon OSP_D]|uniref:Uncharacterized protein n=1 Tax=Candidatus Marsarchaeota G2 archaeon OSP_D TaxID=1978157 RepID=A0A2R6AM83_9ARCH|nr:MAG: hypothetical protein B9Q03_10550 [Candidatus Marsarchaeota G2 archaeon OSP_D]